MAKDKTAVPNKMHTTSGTSGAMSFLLLPIFLILVAMAVSSYVLIATLVAPANSQHQEALINSIAQQHEAYFNSVLGEHDRLLAQIAANQSVIDLITQNDLDELAVTERLIASQVPYGLTAHIFGVRSAREDPDISPPLSFAALDMIRRAEQGQSLSMEAHQHDDQAYLQSVKAVRNKSGRLIGTVAVTQGMEYLHNQLSGMDGGAGNLKIQQQFEGGDVQTLAAYGEQNDNRVISLRSDNPNWTLTFQPADEIANAKILMTDLMWTVFGLLTVACILPIILAGFRLQSALRQDANNFARAMQALLTKQRTTAVEFEFAIFSSLMKTLNRMRMGKAVQVAADDKMGSVLASVMSKPSLSDGSTPFNVAVMDSDADLLDMSQDSAQDSYRDVDERLFTQSDIYGIAGQSLTAETAALIGMAIGSEAHDRGENTLIVGRDGRLSSPELTAALIKGITATGRDVIDIGMVPTPVSYFASEYLKVASGVMVTASEQPVNHNGFKIRLGGNSLSAEEVRGLYYRIENQNFLTGKGKTNSQNVTSAYLTKIKSHIRVERALKVVIDCGNGVAGNLAPQLIKALGCHVLPLSCEVDGNFPNHRPDPAAPENLRDLIRTVSETRADLGIAFDGDGDRLSIITNSGTLVYTDRLLMLLAKPILQSSPGATVVFDVKSSRRLKNLVIGFGGKAIMCPTGHYAVQRKMKETNAALAAEMSGYLFYRDRWFGFDDALYGAVRLIEVLASQAESLDTLINELPVDISTPELVIATSDDRKHRVIEALKRNGQFSGGQVTDIDGVRVDFQDGWGLVRASDRLPKLLCYFEAESKSSLVRIQNLFKQQLAGVDNQLQIPF